MPTGNKTLLKSRKHVTASARANNFVYKNQESCLQGIRGAVSFPWPAVRAAWASSMHQVEEGYLSWADATQWAIIRLSASQVALDHTRALQKTLYIL